MSSAQPTTTPRKRKTSTNPTRADARGGAPPSDVHDEVEHAVADEILQSVGKNFGTARRKPGGLAGAASVMNNNDEDESDDEEQDEYENARGNNLRKVETTCREAHEAMENKNCVEKSGDWNSIFERIRTHIKANPSMAQKRE